MSYSLPEVGLSRYIGQMKTGIGAVVRAAREARGLTQEELAEAINMTPGYVGTLETGKVLRPKPATLRKLAAALQIPLDDLVVATGQLDVHRADVGSQILRIASLPTTQARIDAWRSLPKELRHAMLRLSQDVFQIGAEQLEEE